MMNGLGIILIGRNEGERLKKCIASVRDSGYPVIYVDSGSHDGSASFVRSAGISVLELDTLKPMSAARARNAGFTKLIKENPGIEFAQFIDGDCEVCPGWLAAGAATLAQRPDVGIVCGRVIERHPEASVYNRMCHLEWQKEPGEIMASGGNLMARASAFKLIDGFRIDIMAGEDDEMCLRMRRSGMKVLAIADDMVLHDTAITKFSEWWKRAKRAGMAYAQGNALHGASPDKHFKRNYERSLFWAAGLPTASLLLALPTMGLSLTAFAGYPLLMARIYKAGLAKGMSPRDARAVAFFTVVAKSPEFMGILHYHYRTRWQHKQMELIEFKGIKKSK